MNVSVSTPARQRAVLSSIIGNGLEWYDYMIYGFFAALISQAFFPSEDVLASQLAFYGTYAISFFVRPLAGVVLGRFADTKGRKPALAFMILLMGVSTVLIGITPGYAAIGVLAPVIIIIARIMQGISVGGEFASATSMLTEYAPAGKRMFYGSFQMCSQAFANFLAAAVGIALATGLTQEALSDWGWRIPFLLGGLIAPIGFYIRRKVDESPAFSDIERTRTTPHAPVMDVFRKHWRALFAGLGLVVIGTTSNYVWFIYLTAFVERELHLPFATILLSDVIAGILLFALCPAAGWLADRIGGLRVFVCGVIGFGGLAFPFFAWLSAAPSLDRLITIQAAMCVFIAMIWGPTPGVFASFFPTEIRSTGMSISYNTGVLLFGGMAPVYLTLLQAWRDDPFMPAWYIAAAACLSLILLSLFARSTKQSGEISAAPAI